MFLGTYSPRMDAKGRIILPAKFREELSAGLVLTRGQERCLYVFPAAEFERIHERMRSAPPAGSSRPRLPASIPLGSLGRTTR